MHSNQVSYRILNPTSTHYRPATCEEVDCDHFLNGWQVRVEGLPEELLHTARNSGRSFTEMRVSEGVTYLVFAPGQACFKAKTHLTNIGRNPLFVVDTPADNGRIRRRKHSSADSWGDDLHTHTDDLLGDLGIS